VLVLPFIEQDALFNQLEISKPGGDDRFPNCDADDNSSHPLNALSLACFVCPSCPGPKLNPFFKFNAKANYVCSAMSWTTVSWSASSSALSILNYGVRR
jgi:hypothetical protein